MTPREEACARIDRAKTLMTRAAQAVMDQHPLAAALGDAARAELDEARAELAAIDSQDAAR